ncbi:M20/M25/M40 family metallo-hydrolase [Flavobacteriaceae bacterium Ap0902]|nr:M20/M25/M40 family metallo-hydrolase [Flavobacteriaceae bacterium Ap0902]
MEDQFYTDHSLSFLKKYLNTASPTGYEKAGQLVWMDYIKPYVDEVRTDNYGTAYGVINPDAEFKVVLEAHADEISWYVNYITDNGLIYVVRNGGSDHMIAPSKRVNIHTKNGIVEGVFGWPAIHTRKGDSKEQTPKVESIWVDVGAKDKDEVLAMGIHVGSVITYPDTFHVLNDKYFTCRALDNRAGGFMIAEVARLLHENKDKIDFGVYFTNSVQEEVGLNGAKMITETIKPNVALVTDVTHDTTTPMIDKKKEGDLACGKGPVVAYAPAVHNTLREMIIEAAEENEISFQRSALSRVTGTDTDAFAFSNGGVPSALLSLPLRYMHTTVEMVHKEDVESLIKILYHTVLKIKNNQSFNYFEG